MKIDDRLVEIATSYQTSMAHRSELPFGSAIQHLRLAANARHQCVQLGQYVKEADVKKLADAIKLYTAEMRQALAEMSAILDGMTDVEAIADYEDGVELEDYNLTDTDGVHPAGKRPARIA